MDKSTPTNLDPIDPVTATATAEPDDDSAPPAATRRSEIVVAVVAIVFSAAALVLAQQVEIRREPAPGQIDARFWPTLLASISLALSVWRLIVSFVSAPDNRDDQQRVQQLGLRRLLGTLVASIVFVGLWSIRDVVMFGYRFEVFPVLVALLLAALLWIYGVRTWKALVIFPVAMTVGIYLVFNTLLRIPL